MQQSAAPLTGNVANAFRTLGLLYLHAEPRGSRSALRVVLRTRDAQGWHEMSTWRFFRHVVRAGLYLRERCKLEPGDRVVVLSPLRAERIIIEWAVVAQGGVVVTLDPATASDALARAFEHLRPRVAVVNSAATRDRALGAGGTVERFVLLDGAARPDTTDVTWSTLIDLDGTLDTAERAQAFRAAARAVRPEMPAIGYLDVEPGGRTEWKTASHGAVVDRIVDIWKASPARAGDVAYAVDPGTSASLRLALWALVADGETTLVVGTPGHEQDEVAELRPNVVVGPVEALERATLPQCESRVEPAHRGPWRLAALLASVARRRRPTAGATPVSPRSLTLEGSSWPVTLPITTSR